MKSQIHSHPVHRRVIPEVRRHLPHPTRRTNVSRVHRRSVTFSTHRCSTDESVRNRRLKVPTRMETKKRMEHRQGQKAATMTWKHSKKRNCDRR